MDPIIKKSIQQLASMVGRICSGFSSTVVSVFRIMVLSSLKTAIKSRKYIELKKYRECTVLANGPSLKKAIEENEVRLNGVDVFCVNSFAESEYFWKIKPKFYYLIDNEFFGPTNGRTKLQIEKISDAFSKVDWDMYLCIPSHAINGGVLKALHNSHIKILRWNTSSTDGYDWFCNMIYRLRLGMPDCVNVVNFAIMSGINMRYEKIYLYGIDHTFSAQLFVNDNNVVCSSERHVYNTSPTVFELPQATMTSILYNMSRAFYIHQKLQKYSMHVCVKLINCTKGSFVDAYQRDYSYKATN